LGGVGAATRRPQTWPPRSRRKKGNQPGGFEQDETREHADAVAEDDQVQFEGAGTPRSVVLDQAAMERAVALGRNVAGQLGVVFGQARCLGPPGLCPMCHLDVVALRGADIECATCGARGRLGPDLQVTWTDLSTSVISMDEKQAHAAEIQETARRHAGASEEIEERARAFDAYNPVIRPHRAATAS
jgi:hypothetical protein